MPTPPPLPSRPGSTQRLAKREALALAVAEARRALLDAGDERIGRDWHLARLWLGSGGDGAAPLVVGRRKRSLLPATHEKAFLGKEVPVASHDLFVGRRRELQRALRILDEGQYAGVILTGMGRLGKSSLAARIANRRRDDFALAVLHGRFGLQGLLERIAEALQPYPVARELLRDGQAKVRAASQQGDEAGLVALGDLLTDLLNGPCQQRDADGPALLLVLDDFEQLLDESAGARPVRTRHAGLLASVLRVFDPAATDSRLLITSRFPFRLAEHGRDQAGRLARIELASFQDTAERKLTLRQRAAAQGLNLTDLAAREALLSRVRAAARGNPGLLDLLIAHLLLNPAVPLADAEAALVEMEGYLAGGELPESEKLRELLENIAVQALVGLAGTAGRDLLQAMTLFQLPVPRVVAERLVIEIGGDLQGLIDLALLEPGEDAVQQGQPAVRISPLAECRVPPLGAADQPPLAAIAAGPLFAAWGGEAGRRPAVADLQLARLALAAGDATIAAACGAGAIRALEPEGFTESAAMARVIVALLERAAHPPTPRLLADAARVIAGDGDGTGADALLGRKHRAVTASDAMEAGHLAFQRGKRLMQSGNLDAAEQAFIEAEGHAGTTGDEISVAVVAARSPTSCRRAGSWTRRCASAPKRSCRSTSAWATCASCWFAAPRSR